MQRILDIHLPLDAQLHNDLAAKFPTGLGHKHVLHADERQSPLRGLMALSLALCIRSRKFLDQQGCGIMLFRAAGRQRGVLSFHVCIVSGHEALFSSTASYCLAVLTLIVPLQQAVAALLAYLQQQNIAPRPQSGTELLAQVYKTRLLPTGCQRSGSLW